MKTYDGNDLKLGTVVPVVLDTVLKPADFRFKRSRLRVRVRIVASGSEVIYQNVADVRIYFSVKII